MILSSPETTDPPDPTRKSANGKGNHAMRTHTKRKKTVLGVALSATLIAATTLTGTTSASASTQFVGNTTCPSYVTGGGGCQYVQVDRAVPGATGTMRPIVFFHWTGGGTAYEVYDMRLQNNSSRAFSLIGLNVGNIDNADYNPYQGIASGGSVWDQQLRTGTSFQGRWIAKGSHPTAEFYGYNSGYQYAFYVHADQMP